LQIVELKVHMDCQGCEGRIRRAISKLNGKNSTMHTQWHATKICLKELN